MPVSKKNPNYPKIWQSIKPQQSVRQFENSIIQFHSSHRTSIRQLPYVLGKKINLRKLYIGVLKRGGYKKVNENNEWEEVLEDLNLPKETTNCELAIQSIYHRYLEEYEREQWNALSSGAYAENYANNNNESNTIDIDLSKHSSYISELAVRDKSFLAAFVNDNTPKVFCDYQHIIHNSARIDAGLSSDFKETGEFNHLRMSLLSGLSNEIEFALNTLLIMSNSNQIRLDLRFTGNLLDLILATVGVFEPVPCSYYEQFKDCNWMKDCLQFWNNTVEEGIGRIFLVPNIFQTSRSEIKKLLRNNHITSNPNNNSLFNNDNHYNQITDPCAQRVHLVATVLYNITNDSVVNCRSIINNFQFLRFLFLSVHSTDPVLRRLCLQTLSKLRFVLYPLSNSISLSKSFSRVYGNSVDLDEDDAEEEWFSQFLLDFLQALLSSENRCDRIAALDIVQTLCLIEENHQTLNKSLQPSFVEMISSQLLVPDIHPLCCALESLVSLSQLGEDMCRRMAMCQALLKILLQFIQIEAQMFGPSAVYKIKTFNHRPPIPMPTYHSLPQIMKFPSNSPLRQPFVTPSPSTSVSNFADPNIQIQCSNNILLPVSVANYNSISTVGLSKIPLQNLQKSPQLLHTVSHNINIINNNNNIQNQLSNPLLFKQSQLTPLQQIDQLLTKSIASFENPPIRKSEMDEDEKIKRENHNEKEMENCPDSPDNKDHGAVKLVLEKIDKNATVEKKVVKIKCCIDGPDVEIRGPNDSGKCDIEINGNIKLESIQSNLSSPPIVNGDDIEMPSLNGRESPKISELNSSDLNLNVAQLDKSKIHMNGNLEIDASNFDDPDRRQMPPPSLPTPSMLKKQMRPKLSPPSQVGVANGYLQQLNSKVKRQLVSEMTLTTNAQIEDRCDRAKSWLRQQYRLAEESKSFVLKQDLVNELHEFLFEDDNEDVQAHASKRIFSAHELHSCIKDVFGHKVQVKVEHRLNGKSQLIYSNLSRVNEPPANEKSLPNGIINPVQEMNGVFNHSISKKRHKISHNPTENEIINKKDARKQNQQKKTVNNSSYLNQKPFNVKIKQIRDRAIQNRKRISSLIFKSKRKLTLARKFSLKAAMKLQLKNHKLSKVNLISNMTSTNSSQASTSSPSVIESQLVSPHISENLNDVYLSSLCLWGSCTERFPNDNALHFHITNDHIPLSSATNLSLIRTNCQWQHCLTASVPRAPLSLLSHVIQEHCIKSNLSIMRPPNMAPRLPNQISYNIVSPPSINPIGPPMATNNFSQISEKSGWSVLYDHFRLEEQMQPNLPEGPITKHIRISSSIILRNMSRHSIITKEFLRNNSSLLSIVAMSSQDCAPIIVQCLDELTLPTINDS